MRMVKYREKLIVVSAFVLLSGLSVGAAKTPKFSFQIKEIARFYSYHSKVDVYQQLVAENDEGKTTVYRWNSKDKRFFPVKESPEQLVGQFNLPQETFPGGKKNFSKFYGAYLDLFDAAYLNSSDSILRSKCIQKHSFADLDGKGNPELIITYFPVQKNCIEERQYSQTNYLGVYEANLEGKKLQLYSILEFFIGDCAPRWIDEPIIGDVTGDGYNEIIVRSSTIGSGGGSGIAQIFSIHGEYPCYGYIDGRVIPCDSIR
jgi:hypothetical protein